MLNNHYTWKACTYKRIHTPLDCALSDHGILMQSVSRKHRHNRNVVLAVLITMQAHCIYRSAHAAMLRIFFLVYCCMYVPNLCRSTGLGTSMHNSPPGDWSSKRTRIQKSNVIYTLLCLLRILWWKNHTNGIHRNPIKSLQIESYACLSVCDYRSLDLRIILPRCVLQRTA